jgi:hypothetical protein
MVNPHTNLFFHKPSSQSEIGKTPADCLFWELVTRAIRFCKKSSLYKYIQISKKGESNQKYSVSFTVISDFALKLSR